MYNTYVRVRCCNVRTRKNLTAAVPFRNLAKHLRAAAAHIDRKPERAAPFPAAIDPSNPSTGVRSDEPGCIVSDRFFFPFYYF